MKTVCYEDVWAFWLDDSCYQIARGVRYLAEPSEVSQDFWKAIIEPEIPRLEKYHGVKIRCLGGVVQVAKHQWVFDLYDSTDLRGWKFDAVSGVLLGYSSDAIEQFLVNGCRNEHV